MPALLVGMSISDSLAGERERHTLSTLLASRLPDRAILFGKMVTAILYGWSVTMLAHLLSLLVVNVTNWSGRVQFYAATMAIANVFLSLLLAGMMAALGVLVSLRSATVQGVTPTLMVMQVAPLPIVQIAGAIIRSLRGAAQEGLKDFLGSVNVPMAMLGGGVVLAALCTVLTLATMAHFQRARLILD